MTRLIVEADGGSRGNPGPAGYGALVRDESGAVLAERGGYLGETTNNVAEYSGLVAGLRAASAIDPGADVTVRMDSKLVVEQMSGRWRIRNDDLRSLADEAHGAHAGTTEFEWVPRARNSDADRLANEAMDTRADFARDFDDSETRPGAADGGPGSKATADSRPAGARVRHDDAEPLTAILVRHGVTPMTVAGELSGSDEPGPPLTAHGRTQAAGAADLIHRIGRDLWTDLPRPSALIVSPMTRTRETAAAIGRRLGLPVTIDPRFAEARFGDWQGLTSSAVEEGWPGDLLAWHATGTTRPPGGESYRDVGDRVSAGLASLVDDGVGRTVVVVGHTIQIRAAVGTATGMPPAHWSGLRIPPASVTILRLWTDRASELTTLGLPPHL